VNYFVAGVKLEVDSNFAGRCRSSCSRPFVRARWHYAEYYQGLAELRLWRAADRRPDVQALAAKKPSVICSKPRHLRRSECEQTLQRSAAAMHVFTSGLSKTERPTAPDESG